MKQGYSIRAMIAGMVTAAGLAGWMRIIMS